MFTLTGESGVVYQVEDAPFTAPDGPTRLHRCRDAGGRERIAKLYATPVTDPGTAEAVRTAATRGDATLPQVDGGTAGETPEDSIGFPIDVLADGPGVIGVIMPAVPRPFLYDDGRPRTLDALCSAAANPPASAFRVAVLTRVAEIFSVLAEAELVHGDVSQRTLLWRADVPHAYLFDCDGTPRPGGTADPAYADPRGAARQITAPDAYSDRYALAVLMYRGLLLNPDAPALTGGRWSAAGLPGDLDPRLRDLFDRAFTDPAATGDRPAAAQWRDVLRAVFINPDGSYNTDSVAVLDHYVQRFRDPAAPPATTPMDAAGPAGAAGAAAMAAGAGFPGPGGPGAGGQPASGSPGGPGYGYAAQAGPGNPGDPGYGGQPGAGGPGDPTYGYAAQAGPGGPGDPGYGGQPGPGGPGDPGYGYPPGGPGGPAGPGGPGFGGPGYGPGPGPGGPRRGMSPGLLAVVIIAPILVLGLLVGGIVAWGALHHRATVAEHSPTPYDTPSSPAVTPTDPYTSPTDPYPTDYTPAPDPTTPDDDPTTYEPPEEHWGAIAVASDGRVGKAWDYSSSSTAENRAMSECARSTCKVLTTFVNGCGAVAFNPSTNKYWGGHGETKGEAESNAISNAGGGHWISWVCTTR